MTTTTIKNKVSIPQKEYLRLKGLDKLFSGFLLYLEHFIDIRGAREEVKDKKIIAQEKLFKQLGF